MAENLQPDLANGSQNLAGRYKKIIFDLILNLVVIVGLAVLIRIFIIEPFNVEGSSMCDTLNFIDGKCVNKSERIIVNKLSYFNLLGIEFGDPKRGDIIVFDPPQGREESYIKRIIGLPGETLELLDGEVIIYNKENLSGLVLKEEYLNEKNKGKTFAIGGKKVFKMGENEYFVMGDNRAASTDSRACFRLNAVCEPTDKHFIGKEDIRGKAWFTVWPLSKIRVLK